MLQEQSSREALWFVARAGDALFCRSGRRGMLPHEAHRRAALLNASGIAVLGASMLLLAVGYVGARSEPILERVDLQVSGLATDLNGYRIMQLPASVLSTSILLHTLSSSPDLHGWGSARKSLYQI